jgi:hypothetical protein
MADNNYITPIKFPKFNLELPKNSFKRIAYTDPFPILHNLGLPWRAYFDFLNLQCLEAVIMPQSSLEIHKDTDDKGNPEDIWSLVVCPNNDNCFLEIYEETPETKLLTFKSVSNLTLTHLDPKTAKLVDSWNMKDGACTFNAGAYWHTVRNPTDNYIHMLSFRSKKIESLNILKKLIEPLV